MTVGRRCIVVLALAAPLAAAVAQTTVYESKDKAGPVFSDRPSPDATTLELPAPNVVQMPKVEPAMPTSPQAAAPSSYQSLVIVAPADGHTVHTNTGAFDFAAKAVPALRARDRFRIKLDGRTLPTVYRSTRVLIGQADWQAAAGTDSAEHTLQVAIVDPKGTVLIESLPVRFYVHRATVSRPRR